MSRSLELLTDACAGLAHTARKMFGGHGFFAPNGGMFAGIVTDDEVIFKLERGPARDELLTLGGHPWEWSGGGKPMTMQEWIVVPEGFYDDPEAFAAWASKAHRLVPAKVAKKSAKKSAKPKAPASAPKKAAAKKARAATKKPALERRAPRR